MKYKDYYLKLMFVDDGQEEIGFADFLTKLQRGDRFPTRFIDVKDPEDSFEIDFKAKLFSVAVKSIEIASRDDAVLLGTELETRQVVIGILIGENAPSGIVLGAYKLLFLNGICENLPDDMFEDREVEE